MIDVREHWRIADYCRAWCYRNKGFVDLGTILELPGQEFTVIGKLYWRFADRKKPALSLEWQSLCAICQAPYSFNVPRRGFTSLVRTCPNHRKQFATPRTKQPRKPRDRKGGGALQLAISAELEALSLIHASLPLSALATLLSSLATHNPPQRDTRRQRCLEALQRMADKGLIAIDNGQVALS